MASDYFVSTFHFFVPHNLVWSDWLAFWSEQSEPYYDVWCDG